MIRLLLIAVVLFSGCSIKEKVFVVQRANSSLAIIKDHKLKNEIKNLHDLSHGVVKFYENDGYLITRDGFIIKFDPIDEKVIKEYKTSKSAIGFVVDKEFIAVANYENKSVNILDRDLNPLQTFNTDSKNVGIKIYKEYLIFSLMDKDEIWVLKKDGQKFKVYKKFKDVGVAPFDAMITRDKYIVGFFKSPHFGVVDLKDMSYKKIDLLQDDKKPVLKVPHFGFWSISKDKIFIPAVGENKIFVFSKEFEFIKSIKTLGLAVFTSLSPNEDKMCITFSGKDFPTIQILDTKELKIIKTLKHSGKILHIRWSKNEPILYVSNNSDSKVILYDTNSWKIKTKIAVKKPSGIFIYEEKR